VETHLHGLNAQVGWDSMKSNFRPPDTGDASNRWRMVCGGKSYSISGGNGSVVVTFASDADQGDPSFTTAPRVTVTSVQYNYIPAVVVATTTTVEIDVEEPNGGTTNRDVDVHWIAYGKVA